MSAQVSRNIFFLTASRAVALVLLFFAYTRLFRYLGPFASGQYQFVLSYVLLFATIADFGIQQLITKRMSERPELTGKYFRDFFSFELLASATLYAVLLAVAAVRGLEQPVLQGVALAGLGMAANAMTYPYLAVMAARQDLGRVAWVNFLNSLVNVTVIFLAIVFGKGIVFLSSVQLVFGIFSLVLYRSFTRRHLKQAAQPAKLGLLDWAAVGELLRQGWPFALLVGFAAVYNRIDMVLITFLRGYTETGYYTAAYKIFDLLGFFPSVVSYALFPFFASLMSKGLVAEVRASLERYLRLMTAAALPMAVGGTFLAGRLIALVAGDEFAPAATALSVLIWAPAVLFFYIPVNALVISQLTKKAAAVTGFNVLFNLAGNFLLIPRYGIMGAAVMTVASEAIQCCGYFILTRRHITKFSFLSGIWRPAVAAAVMGAVLWRFSGLALPAALAIGGLVYVASLLILGFFGKEDTVAIRRLFGWGSGDV